MVRLLTSCWMEGVPKAQPSHLILVALFLSVTILCFISCVAIKIILLFDFAVIDLLLTFAAIIRVVGFGLFADGIRGTHDLWQQVSGKFLYASLASELCRIYAELHQTGSKASYLPRHIGAWVYLPIQGYVLFLVLLCVHRYRQLIGTIVPADSLATFPVCMGLFCFVSYYTITQMGDKIISGTVQHICFSLSYWIDALAVLCQLWLVGRQKTINRSLASAFALLVVSRFVTGVFYAMHYNMNNQLTDDKATGFGVLGSHIAYLLLSSDYILNYARSWGSGRMDIELLDV